MVAHLQLLSGGIWVAMSGRHCSTRTCSNNRFLVELEAAKAEERAQNGEDKKEQ
jgi:hypothetical protein